MTKEMKNDVCTMAALQFWYHNPGYDYRDGILDYGEWRIKNGELGSKVDKIG